MNQIFLKTEARLVLKRKVIVFISLTAAAKSLQSCPTVRPHRRQPTRLPVSGFSRQELEQGAIAFSDLYSLTLGQMKNPSFQNWDQWHTMFTTEVDFLLSFPFSFLEWDDSNTHNRYCILYAYQSLRTMIYTLNYTKNNNTENSYSALAMCQILSALYTVSK